MDDDISSLERLESGLHELEPIPTDTTSLYEASSSIDNDDNNDKKSRSRQPNATTTGLGLSQHSAIWYLTRVQKYSSYVFTAFAAMHITNTSLIPLLTQSVPASEPYLLLTRPYYQSPAVEPLMVALPLWGHILSGVAIRVIRRNQNAQRYGDAYSAENKQSFFTNTHKFWPKVSGTSKLGYIFVPLALGHIVLNRAVPQVYYKSGGGNIDLAYVSHAFAKHPIVSFAGFAALLGVGCFHFTWGFAKYFGWSPEQVTEFGARRELRKRRRWIVINAIAAAITGLWMAGSFGVVARHGEAPGWVGREYNEMYRMIPLIGRWL
ncbi:uncharacterized protein SEPMUDRAFT_68467 [Sphaerulina musiva SO2202]|uniref:Mitochondrial adapter protein MCP1 transmembrane domain-containing protein n=1 Tax=Sphaerulina musiva (strain SO2202) TaxID=692275 RepID=M3D213_SPHMS|nr:uncharacterized protein SEPMUDRAFT_68467 [Sphaerulina musiva SO2202]EMF11147.1 hypothetical protein SEPMUDRAFT_68467 [Sphaerulina musiva SO2202]